MKEVPETDSEWRSMRLRIYRSYLHVNCGGDTEAALLFLNDFVQYVNRILLMNTNYSQQCDIKYDECYHITNLEGFSKQAGWLLVGMLLNKKWEVVDFRYEPVFGEEIDLIDMLKYSTNPEYYLL